MSSLPSLFTLIHELIALPSISCVNPQWDQSNLAVIERLAQWCETLGFRCEIMPVPDTVGKYNLIATLGTGSGGLVFAGHTDTVPYDAGRWQHDPFKLTEADQRLYGLGTSDMKAFFAFALTAAAQFRAEQFQEPLILLATADEECSMSGARALAAAGKPKARYAIIGEPTGLRPVNMHKGIIMEAVRIRGLSGHSSNPALGNSALEGMHKVIGALLEWRAELQAKNHNPVFAVPFPTLNLGHIHGGDNPNRICGECELHLDIRPLPSMKISDLHAELKQRVQKTLADTGLNVEVFSLFNGVPPVETLATSDIVRVAEKLTQHTAEAVAFCTEAPFLNALGMQTIVLGPGDIAQAHQPDEYIALDRIKPTLEMLTTMIQHFCCGQKIAL